MNAFSTSSEPRLIRVRSVHGTAASRFGATWATVLAAVALPLAFLESAGQAATVPVDVLKPVPPAASPRLVVSSGSSHRPDQPSIAFMVQGQPVTPYSVQASTDFTRWVPLVTNVTGIDGTFQFTDGGGNNSVGRFYRALSITPPASHVLLAVAPYRRDRVLVKPKAGLDLGLVLAATGTHVVWAFPQLGNWQVIGLPATLDVDTAITTFQQSAAVDYAERDYIVKPLRGSSDPYYTDGTLWGLHNTGQQGGKAGADIDAPDAWDLQNSAAAIVVAVIDSGVRYTHEDLADNMWVNPAPGSDGYSNDVHGVNAINNTGDPNDDHGHGTHVAGVIGAVGNNGLGVVGVAWKVQIMACKFLDSQANGSISDAIKCIDYARSHSAKIINASWGDTTFTSQALKDAVRATRDAGIIFVAACGNDGADNDVKPLYPAGYTDLDNVVAVAATDRTDAKASFSNYGRTTVHLGAPGDESFSCANTSDSAYANMAGTSFAAAMVSGACAVVWAHYPGDNYKQIIDRVLANTDALPSLSGKCVTGGRLNLYKALTGSSAPPPPPPVAASFSANPTAGQAPLTVQFTDTSTGPVTAWDWNFGNGSAHSTVQNPAYTYTNAGAFTVTLTVTGSGGTSSSASQSITVTNVPASQQPVITLLSSQPDAYEKGPVPGAIRFHRTGDASQAIEIYWTFSGTATNGVDYQQLPTHSPFPAGSSDADLTITPIDRAQGDGDKTVTVTLAPGSAYQMGSPDSQTVTIHDAQTGPTAPTASFTANPTSGAAPLTVQFTDTSTGPVAAWDWNFGNGSAHSTVQNPAYTYTNAGAFTVTLTVTGSGGATSSASQSITVTNMPASQQPVITLLSSQPDAYEKGPVPGAIRFHRTGDTSQAIEIYWTFSGTATNGVDYQQLPTHSPFPAGSSDADLTITPIDQTQGDGDKTVTVTLAPGSAYQMGSPDSQTVTLHDAQTGPTAPGADFTANPTSGQAPLTVQFTDKSTGTVNSWDWDFGDGSSHSSSQNPSHTYTNAGTYSVTLVVTGNGGATSTKSATIQVTSPPPLPVVTVQVTVSITSELGLPPGEFTFTRTGDTSASLTVRFSTGGSAVPGTDYKALPDSVTIPAGAASATVLVAALNDPLRDLIETVSVTLVSDSSYQIGGANSASVTLLPTVSAH